MAEKLSVKLNAMLDESDRNKVTALFNFDEKLEEFYNKVTCTPEERESIANKELNITYLVEQIVQIKNKKITNAEKKEEIQQLLKDADIEYILEEVKEEIEKVKALLLEKLKEASNELQSQFGILEESFSKVIDSSIETEQEKVDDAEEKKKKILEDEKEKGQDKDDAQMVKYEGNGFWDKFKRIREEGKTEKGKKVGIFKALFMAGKEYFKENREIREKQIEANMSPEEKAANEEVRKKEEELKALDEQIKASKENTKKLKEQRKELKGKLAEACEKAMETAKGTYEEAIEPIPEAEVTEERCASLFERIAEFREGRREARHEKKINKLKDKIQDKTSDIEKLSGEIKGLSAKREEEVNRIVDGREGEDLDRRELDKDIDYDINLLNKRQKQRFNLAKKVEKENAKYTERKERNNRNEGMDR